jgi:hypothetical protein
MTCLIISNKFVPILRSGVGHFVKASVYFDGEMIFHPFNFLAKIIVGGSHLINIFFESEALKKYVY